MPCYLWVQGLAARGSSTPVRRDVDEPQQQPGEGRYQRDHREEVRRPQLRPVRAECAREQVPAKLAENHSAIVVAASAAGARRPNNARPVGRMNSSPVVITTMNATSQSQCDGAPIAADCIDTKATSVARRAIRPQCHAPQRPRGRMRPAAPGPDREQHRRQREHQQRIEGLEPGARIVHASPA